MAYADQLAQFSSGQLPFGIQNNKPFMQSWFDRTPGGFAAKYETTPLDQEQLMNLLRQYLGQSQQSAIGQASQQAGAIAASKGWNPYAAIQHATSPIYGQYAGQMGKAATEIPMLAFNSQLAANNANAQNYMNREQANFMQDQAGFNFFRDFMPGLLSLGGNIGGALINAHGKK